ncbi:hypothetical protein CDCA_CDCA05G1520 [Cyanidium caldarium]|uniref:Uncharacterized protein n=1 Tax=Cyanidium caldarium TaxID=2771 RepID=A0AAV9ITS1_CYACA|nr:hypothetical protein CDCA_CDCA05G1520 [Cyanidium caldarium]
MALARWARLVRQALHSPNASRAAVVDPALCYSRTTPRRHLVVKATCPTPQDTSKTHAVALSSLSYRYVMRRYTRQLADYLGNPESVVELSAADKEAVLQDMLATAQRAGYTDITEEWLRENIHMKDRYQMKELMPKTG